MTDAPTEFTLPDGVTECRGRGATGGPLPARGRARPSRSSGPSTTRSTAGCTAPGCGWPTTGSALAALNGTGEVARAAVSRRSPAARVFASELPAGRLRDVLAPIVEMRALTPLVRVRSTLRPLRVLDGEEKTVVRLVLEQPQLVDEGGARRGLGAAPARGRSPRLRRRAGAGVPRAGGRARLRRRRGGRCSTRPSPRRAARPPACRRRSGSRCHPEQRADAAAAVLLLAPRRHDRAEPAGHARRRRHRVPARPPRRRAPHALAAAPAARASSRRSRSRTSAPSSAGCSRSPAARATSTSTCSSSTASSPRSPSAPRRPRAAARLLVDHRGRERSRHGPRAALRRAARRCSPTGRRSSKGSSTSRSTTGPSATRPVADVAAERIGTVYRRMVKMGARDRRRRARPRRCTTCARRARSCATCSSSSPALYPDEVVRPMVEHAEGRCRTRSAASRTARSRPRRCARWATRSRGRRRPAALMAMGVLVEQPRGRPGGARAEFAERFAAFAAQASSARSCGRRSR